MFYPCAFYFLIFKIKEISMPDSKTFKAEAFEYAEDITNTVREPLIILNQDLRLISASRGFYELFTVKPEAAEGQLFFDLGNQQWDIPEMRQLLETLLPRKTILDDYEVEHEFADIGKRTMLVNARQTQSVPGKESIILLAIEDITERKKDEEKLRKIYNNTHDAIIIHDRNGKIIDVNNRMCQIYNLSKEEAVACTIEDISSPDMSFQDLSEIWRKVLNDENQFFEWEAFRPKYRSIFPVEVSLAKIDLYNDFFIIANIRDVTQRKQKENALRQSKSYYRAIFETSGAAMFILEEDTTISHVNSNFEELLGYSKQEVEGKKFWTEFLHSDDADWMRQNHYLRGHDPLAGPCEYEFRFFARNGELRYGYLTVDIIPDTTQSVISVIDITERKKAEQQLRESEEKYRVLVENLNEVIYALDEKGRITYVSPPIKSLTGYTPSELTGKHYICFVHPDDKERLLKNFQSSSRGIDRRIEYRFITKENRIVWIRTAARPLLEEGEVTGVQGVLTDITERKQAEKEQEKLQAQLNQAQKMESVGRLAGGVAHDFNNKLTIINGYAEMAIDIMDPSDPLRETIQEIHTAGKQSAAIVRQLLAFARKQTISPVQLDLNNTISSMLKMLHRLIGENIDLAWHPGNNLWPVKIDPSQVDQIMANLVVNARDAIADVGKITIETNNIEVDEDYCTLYSYFVPGQYVILAVSDNGYGMDKETLKNLFEPFFTTKDVGQGTGLGLATIYGIVKQNNGFINVYSEPGMGTTFKIYLPRHESEEPFVKPAIESTGQIPSGTETLLIVEDEKGVLQMSKVILERLGYTILIAENPSAALQLAEKYHGTIHLLITDVVMPEMNGRDLASRLAVSRPGLKTLYMSGYTANAIAHNGVLDKDVLFVQKPFPMQDLAVKVREAIEQE